MAYAAPAPRPVARAQRLRFAVASTPKQGTYGGSTSPEGEDKQAKNEAAGCAMIVTLVASWQRLICGNVLHADFNALQAERPCSTSHLWPCTGNNWCSVRSKPTPLGHVHACLGSSS